MRVLSTGWIGVLHSATLGTRYGGVGRYIGRLEHISEVPDSLKEFGGFIFLNISFLFPSGGCFDICFEVGSFVILSVCPPPPLPSLLS